MKKLLFMLSMFILPFASSALDFNINKKLKDHNGCEWHIKGTISTSWGSLSSYDITATDCHGNKYHFVGANPQPIEGEDVDINDFNNEIHTLEGDPLTAEEIQFVYSVIMLANNENNQN